jgi:predicted DNA-binding transcriptional regulator AlpA
MANHVATATGENPARLALRMADLTRLTGLSRRLIERERSAGRFPQPDRVVGRCPLWRPETISAWLSLESGR